MELMERKPKIKPKSWTPRILGDIGDVRMCRRIFSYETKIRGDIPFYKIGTFGKEPDAYISRAIYDDYRRKFSFPVQGTVLISAAGTIGRTIIYRGEDAYYQDSNIVWIDNNEKIVLNSFLFYLLKIVKYNTEGGTIQRLYNSIIKSARFECPPIDEQRRIATALQDVDELIYTLEKLIEKKKDIKHGAMQRLLTPPEKGGKRLPGFNGKWEKINLGKSALLKARIGWQGLTTAEYLSSGNYRLVTGTDFNEGFIDWNNCVYVEKLRYDQDKFIQLKINDVLVTKDGTIGKVALVDELIVPATLNSGVFVIRSLNNSFDQKFLYHILMSEHFIEFLNKLSAGSTISHLYQKDFVHFDFFAPPSKEEQEAIAIILSDMDTEIKKLENRKLKVENIKNGMIQELLTGKTRLI